MLTSHLGKLHNSSMISRFGARNFMVFNKCRKSKIVSPKSMYRGKAFYHYNFRDLFSTVERYLPKRSLTYTLIGLNCGLFVLYQLCRNMGMMAQMRFLDQFSLSRKNFSYGRYWTLFTAHLVDHNIFDVLLNSCLLYYFGREMERAFGNRMLLRALICTSIVGSLVLCVKMLGNYQDITYMGTHSYLRWMIYYLVLRYPYNDIILFKGAPRVPFFILGGLILFVDLIRMDTACLGGFLSALTLYVL